MLKSPCLECEFRNSDKNNVACMTCRKRIAYLNGSPPPGYTAPTAVNTIHSTKLEAKPKMDTPKPQPSESVKAENIPPTIPQPKTKFCANPNCKEPQPRPLTEFDANKTSADGLAPRGKSCRRDYQKAYKQNKKAKNRKPSTMETKDIQAPPEILSHTSVHPVHTCPQSPPRPPTSTLSLTLDFTNHPNLLETVTEAAKRDFRTVNNQILYYIGLRHETWDIP